MSPWSSRAQEMPNSQVDRLLTGSSKADYFLNCSSMSSDDVVIERSGGPDELAWESHKSRIVDLYKSKDKTLREVIEIMKAQHKFKARCTGIAFANGMLKKFQERSDARHPA
ncbi:uncharacterized protein KY384_002309 [Bacidia gigantensis]|uniref:uncharacterized protein n=1 Tax=Bacidia gigantensis TaxID=2732470 RepID=UPI001D051DF3|nr:uncharacterized protein KY384_002309 [Bacidia gigantensis]KAG8533523.1 hypothetical protein KY384_002309 [Bacidia gigantensis]